MTTRNLKFYGFAYGDTPVTLDVKINKQQVFLDTVKTIPGQAPLNIQNIVFDQVLFEITGTDLFHITMEGSYEHSIAVSGGHSIIIGPVLSNYMTHIEDDAYMNGNATTFVGVYHGTPANSDNSPDVRSSVKIDNVAQAPLVGPSLGIWTWQVNAGSNLSCNLNIAVGSNLA